MVKFIIKAGALGDVDAASFQGQGAAYYLNAANHTGSVPITRGGTGLTGVPSDGAILIGNGSAYNLTTTPSFTGNVRFGSSINAWDTTTPGTSVGGIHLGGSSATSNAGPALTFGGRRFFIWNYCPGRYLHQFWQWLWNQNVFWNY